MLLNFLLPVLSVTALHAVHAEPSQYCRTLHEDFLLRQPDGKPYAIENGTKHVPFIVFNPETFTATVFVGNGDDEEGVFHPMVASDDPNEVHFVSHIYLVNEFEEILGVDTMNPNDGAPAVARFKVPEGTTEIKAYEFCNLHGLWVGPSLNITTETTTGQILSEARSAGLENVINNEKGCVVDPIDPDVWPSYHADFVRRQSLPPFELAEPYTIDDGAKHTPFLALNENKTKAIVKVGDGDKPGGTYHVMVPFELDTESSTETSAHWITEIYVMDQDGNIISMQTLDPTFVDIAEVTVDVPAGTESLTAYEWCNIHGLWVGPTVRLDGEHENSLKPLASAESNDSKARNPLKTLCFVSTISMLLTQVLEW